MHVLVDRRGRVYRRWLRVCRPGLRQNIRRHGVRREWTLVGLGSGRRTSVVSNTAGRVAASHTVRDWLVIRWVRGMIPIRAWVRVWRRTESSWALGHPLCAPRDLAWERVVSIVTSKK